MFIEENISLEELKKKITEKISYLKQEIMRSEKMLNNPGFINKAPNEKIELEQNKLASNSHELKQYEERLLSLK